MLIYAFWGEILSANAVKIGVVVKFEKIYIELSDICALQCDFCPAKKGVRGVMSVGDFAKIAAKLAHKARIYTFHLLGDPLILPNLSEYIAIANALKMPVELTTSGFYMSEKNAKLLLESENIRQINFSLMAFLAQNKVNFRDYFAPILAFLREHLALKKRNFVNLRLWNLAKNFTPPPQNEPIYELLENKFNVKIDKFAPKNRLASRIILQQASKFQWASAKNTAKFSESRGDNGVLNGAKFGENGVKFSANDRNIVFSNGVANFSDKTAARAKVSNAHAKGTCYGLRGQIAILSTGVVVPCCMDSGGVMGLGELLRQDLSEILSSPRALAIKRGFERGELIEVLCQNCEFGRSKTAKKI